MIKRFFSGYHDFKCIADQCPASCCSGWAIEIDDASLTKYENFCSNSSAQYSKEEKQDFSRRINWQEGIFMQQENGDCAFLRPDGLCHMQACYGEDFLCKTCDMYPRHMEEFPQIEEYSLSVSCPVAAKMLLEHKDKLSFTEESFPSVTDDADDDYEDFQYDLYETLAACRMEALTLMTNRDESYALRARTFLTFMRILQDAIDCGDLTPPETLIQAFPKASAKLSGSMDFVSCSEILFPDWEPSDLLKLLLELEPLRMDFRAYLEKVCEELPLDPNSIQALEQEFREAHPNVELYLENISVYFLFTYMCGAVYDDYVYSMSCMAIYNAYMILLLWMGKWYIDCKKERPLSLDELCEVLYSYSRELEHSNENMILLEELLDQI